MRADRIEATYLIETPLDPEKVAAIMAGEQSSGTFVKVAGETDELRARAAAEVLSPMSAPIFRRWRPPWQATSTTLAK